jgi:hypothetical protein
LLGDWKSWDEEKYALLKPALWQRGGKFVSLDHEVPLGGAGSTTGISLTDVYGDGGGEPDPDDTTAPTVPAGRPPRRRRAVCPCRGRPPPTTCV